jgi:hypothetical protein
LPPPPVLVATFAPGLSRPPRRFSPRKWGGLPFAGARRLLQFLAQPLDLLLQPLVFFSQPDILLLPSQLLLALLPLLLSHLPYVTGLRSVCPVLRGKKIQLDYARITTARQLDKSIADPDCGRLRLAH